MGATRPHYSNDSFSIFSLLQIAACRDRPSLPPTALLVEADLSLVLLPLLQCLGHLLGHALAGVTAVQEAAAAVLLHHLGPGEARQLTEAVRAVDDGVSAVALGVPQQEVAVCKKKNQIWSFPEAFHRTQSFASNYSMDCFLVATTSGALGRF